ncbi:hypothetical protein [Sphingomonas sp. HMP6]|uniref:hypothetical protein n=1 Tax=Sphingomonas sp. HMP6 TaxID=1517551 RepID=UPI0015968CE9|nr:hypothetical protein [Sphingomonas sp. HMP6]
MAKVTELPEVVAPNGEEPVIIISGGRAKRTRFDRLATIINNSVAAAGTAAANAIADAKALALNNIDTARIAALAAINSLGASIIDTIAALVASANPISYGKLTKPSVHRPPPAIADADGNAPLTIFQGWSVVLTYTTRQAINAGKPIEFTVSKTGGVPDPAGRMQVYAGADYPMVRSGNALTYRGTVPAGTEVLRFQALSDGTVTYGPAQVSVGGGITQPTDNASLAHVGAKQDAFDQTLPLRLNPAIYGAPANYALTGKITLPAHSNGFWSVEIIGDFTAGQPLTTQFECSSDLQTVVQYVGIRYNNGDAGPASGHPAVSLDYRGDGSYLVRDYFDPAVGASKPTVIRMTWNNTTDADFVIDNLRVYPSDNPPVHTKVPALVGRTIEDRVALESSYGPWPIRVLINGDSTFAPHFNASVRSIGYFLNQLLNGRLRVIEIGAQGASADAILAANDLWNLTGNVVGNYIPADGSEFEFSNWNHPPVTINSLNNPQNNCRAAIFGNEIVFTRGVFGGSTGAVPSRLWGRAVNKSEKNIYIPNGSRVTMQQGRSASRDINIMQTSTVNGSLVGSDGAAYTQWYAMRCAGRSADFIARTQARWIFMPAIQGVPAGTVPATPNLGSTAAVASLRAAGCPDSCILDPNAPQGAQGSGTGGVNREYLSDLKAQLLNALLGYVKPNIGILYQQQKLGYRSDDFSRVATTGDAYHQNELYNAARAIDIFLFPAFQACLNNPD